MIAVPIIVLIPHHSAQQRIGLRKAINTRPVLLVFGLDENALSKTNITVKRFETADILWAQFIVNNRSETSYSANARMRDNNLDAKYAIVIGQIADGHVSQISRILSKNRKDVDDEVVAKLTEAVYPLQYSFHTHDAIKALGKPKMEYIR